MSDEQKNADVEKQPPSPPPPLKRDVDFLQSLVSLGTIKEAKRTPVISGAVILIYVVLCAKVVVGMISLKTCPINALIPIYLIVAGVTGIAIKILFVTTNRCLFNTLLALLVFYCIWHVICSYFVFKEYHPNYDPEEGPYCSRLTYLVAFWSLVLQYMLLLVFLMLCICSFLMRKDNKT